MQSATASARLVAAPAGAGALDSPLEAESGQVVRPGSREQVRCRRLFWGWLAVRTALWTLVAGLTQANAPLDVIEMLFWGREWRWGYHKHPPLPAWLAEGAVRLVPGTLWGVYLASFAAVGVCFWAVWRLASRLLPPRSALAAALSLEAVFYYSYTGAELNNNILLATGWALAVLGFHRALRTGRLHSWLALGLVVGLTLLAKYSLAFLLLPMFLFLVLHPEARRAWRGPGPYLAGLVALAVFAPHIASAYQHDFSTLQWARSQSTRASHWFQHFTFPMEFALSQLWAVVPLGLVLLPFLSWRWRRRAVAAEHRFDRDFLAAMVLGPVLVLLTMSCVGGMRLRMMWGFPLWTFAGLALLHSLQTQPSRRACRRAMLSAGLIGGVLLVVVLSQNLFGAVLSGKPVRTDFPGRALAEEVNRKWEQRYGGPVPLVAGEFWLAGNVSCYCSHRPPVYGSRDPYQFDPSPRASPWTSDEDFRSRGGVLLWNAAQWGDDVTLPLRARFPGLEVQPPLVLPYQCRVPVPPARIGLAILPPQ